MTFNPFLLVRQNRRKARIFHVQILVEHVRVWIRLTEDWIFPQRTKLEHRKIEKVICSVRGTLRNSSNVDLGIQGQVYLKKVSARVRNACSRV